MVRAISATAAVVALALTAGCSGMPFAAGAERHAMLKEIAQLRASNERLAGVVAGQSITGATLNETVKKLEGRVDGLARSVETLPGYVDQATQTLLDLSEEIRQRDGCIAPRRCIIPPYEVRGDEGR